MSARSKEPDALCAREHVSIVPYFGLASGFLTAVPQRRGQEQISRGAGMDKYLDKGLKVLAASTRCWSAGRDQPKSLADHGETRDRCADRERDVGCAVTEFMGALRLKLSAADVAQLDAASA
jgi:aryl-alcohol dehydrogenase-like predicted oxidoreductase